MGWGVFLKYAIQFVAVASTLVAGPVSFSSRLATPAADGKLSVAGLAWYTGTKDEVEFSLKVTCALIVLGLTMVNDAVTIAWPLARLKEFHSKYLDQFASEWEELLGPEFRMNVMYVRVRWHRLFLPAFEWAWSNRFKPPHHRDANMKLMSWQGIAGRAYYAQQPRSVYFDSAKATPCGVFSPPYYMTKRQTSRTAGIHAIISVPIFRKSGGPSPNFSCVGVINIDALSKDAAERFAKNEAEIANYFIEFGLALGDLYM